LFLAFPAIICASATLIEKREKEKKARAGFNDLVRARLAAGLDAAVVDSKAPPRGLTWMYPTEVVGNFLPCSPRRLDCPGAATVADCN
jgi:hypothetical protein